MLKKLLFIGLTISLCLFSNHVLAETETAVNAADANELRADAKVDANVENVETEALEIPDAFDTFLAIQPELNHSPANPLAAVPACFLECRRNSDCHPSGACPCIFIFPACGYCAC